MSDRRFLRRPSKLLPVLLGLVAFSSFESPAWSEDKPSPRAQRKAKELPLASPDEPISPTFSRQRAVAFLDKEATDWTKKHQCGTCHTNYPYLSARAALKLKDEQTPALDNVRTYFEGRVRHWDDDERGAAPKWDAEVISTASALAMNDRLTTGKLQPTTKQALDRMWTLQRPDGAWNWLKAKLPPYEHDDYYGAISAALAVGYAPDDYSKSESARKGVEALRGYFQKTPPPDLHHKTMLLWASTKLDGLMKAEDRERTIQELRRLQRPDGGWNLASLAPWKRHDGTANDPNGPSDGYATGLIVFVLRQVDVPRSDPAIEKGTAWLKSHQRVSGRWFTRSPSKDGKHYISTAGSCFAVMALAACDALDDGTKVSER